MKLLLDSHVPPVVARELRARSGVDVLALREWREGHMLEAEDRQILLQAHTEERVFVTYDQATILPLTKELAEDETPHGGVIFVDDRTVAQGDVGGLIRGLIKLVNDLGDVEWENCIAFLHP